MTANTRCLPHPLPLLPVPSSETRLTALCKSEGRTSVMTLRWLAAGWIWVEGGNRITWWMIQLPSGEIHGGGPEPGSLGLGSAVSGVGDGGYAQDGGYPADH
jgi:hypothetical protein